VAKHRGNLGDAGSRALPTMKAWMRVASRMACQTSETSEMSKTTVVSKTAFVMDLSTRLVEDGLPFQWHQLSS